LVSVVVAVRIGTIPGPSVLKGCGLHRMVAANTVAVAVSNSILSIIFVRLMPMGILLFLVHVRKSVALLSRRSADAGVIA
jgi:hypothetical protein